MFFGPSVVMCLNVPAGILSPTLIVMVGSSSDHGDRIGRDIDSRPILISPTVGGLSSTVQLRFPAPESEFSG